MLGVPMSLCNSSYVIIVYKMKIICVIKTTHSVIYTVCLHSFTYRISDKWIDVKILYLKTPGSLKITKDNTSRT